MNPSIDKEGLAINIDLDSNALHFELAIEVGQYFNLREDRMKHIKEEIVDTVSTWKERANRLNIPGAQIKLMEEAFRTT